jgi:amino acid adenylation domain-containing protein
MNMNMDTGVIELIKLLADSNVEIKLDEDHLAVSAAKGSMSPDLLEKLKTHKQVLIAYLKQSHRAVPRINPVIREQDIALSYAQQRLWLLDKIDGGSSHYNMPDALHLRGKLDVDALHGAFNEILLRHECLRTCFKENGDGHPYLDIQQAQILNIEIHDLSELDNAQKNAELESLVQRESEALFDLSKDIMLRARLIKLADDEHVLLATTHHIASDGWSRSIIIGEFCALYRAFKQGQESPLPPLPVQYADYAHWQREWLQGELLDEQLGYWENQLRSLPPVHSLPLDHTRPESQTFNGNIVTRKMDRESMDRFNALCQAHGATLFMGLHSVLSTLLSRHSNESDIVVGTLIANREQPEIANLIGFFANSLVLRSDLSAKPNFVELLQQSRRVLLEAYEYQQVPFEKIVERLQPARNISYSPLYQIVLVLQNNEEGSIDLPDLSMDTLSGEVQNVARYDMTLDITQSKDGLVLNWGYNKDLFEEITIQRMAEHFEVLLQAAIKKPEESVFSVEMVTSEERNLLLNEWNVVEAKFASETCLHELFERHADENSDAVALTFEGQELSYGDLNRKANKLANYLIENKSVKPDFLVGICLDRSFDMIISILAVLKAGGAYVPLDPKYPKSRLQYMVEDAGLSVVLTNKQQQDLDVFSTDITVCLDDEPFITGLGNYSEDNIAPASLGLSPSHLAYLIYTSGSTGNPKGVMVEHHNVTRLLETSQNHFEFSNDDTWCLFHSFSFDFSVWEIWGALGYGGRLVIMPYSVTRSTSDFYHALQTEKITVLNQTPSAFNSLVTQDQEEQAELSLRYVIFGGEALNFTMLRPWVEIHGDSAPELINMYGITETTVHTTFKRLSRAVIFDESIGNLIGETLPDLSMFILDKQKLLTPIGVVGEIYVGGAGVARGYFQRTELNAERFLTLDRFDNCRVYRSGDLARYSLSGELEYIGRMDSQVKLRGFRIELGEIESQVLKLDGIKEVAVLCRGIEDEKRIVVYVVPCDSEIRADSVGQEVVDNYINILKTTLPEFMVPSVFVVMDALPLDNNGKLDRKKLPETDYALKLEEYIAPRNSLEEEIATAWMEILAPIRQVGAKIGVNDDFFLLGGNSLLVVRLAAKIRLIGHEVSVRDIVQSPTIAGIASRINDNVATTDDDFLNSQEFVLDSTKGQFHVTPSQSRLLKQGKSYNENRFKDLIFDVHEKIDLDILNRTVVTIINHHDALRSRFFKNVTEQWMTSIAEKMETYEVVIEDLSGVERNSDIEKSCIEFFSRFKKCVDIYNGPVFAVAYAKLPDGQPDRLCFSTHHIVYDGHSLDLIYKDFHHVYDSLRKGTVPELPTTASIVQIGNWVHNNPASQSLFDATKSWLKSVKTELMPLDINVDGDRDKLNTFGTSDELIKTLPLDSEKIKNLDLAPLCKIALINTLAKWSGQNQIEIIELSAFRYDLAMLANLDLSRTVGLITGDKVQVLKPMFEDSLGLRLARLREQLAAIPYDGMLLKHASEFVNDGRQLIHYETRFNFLIPPAPSTDNDSIGVLDFRADDVGYEDKELEPIYNGEAIRANLFMINAVQNEGGLVLSWDYSKNLYLESTIENLLNDYIVEIETMLAM